MIRVKPWIILSINRTLEDNIINVIELKEELRKSQQLVKDFQSDIERVCVEYDLLQMKSTHIEVRYEVLVEQLKDKLCKVMYEQQEESCFEVEDIENKINDEFKLDVTKEFFDECFDENDLESTSDEEKDMLRSIFDEWMCFVCLVIRKLIWIKVKSAG